MARITKTFGEHDDGTMAQLEDVASRAEYAALMADGHFGYTMPVGGVCAYDERVSIAGVGVDIACGNAAIKTDLTIEDAFGFTAEEAASNPHRLASNPRANELADEIFHRIQFGAGKVNREPDAPKDHPMFRDDAWWAIPNEGGFRDDLMAKAREQLGTVGGGNHYVDVFVDEAGCLWVGVHFGSRGFGYTVSTNFRALSAGERWGSRVRDHEGLVHLDNPIGHDYWRLMRLAGDYAYAGREWACRKVVGLLGAGEVDLVHNNHNFAWREVHHGRPLIVVRKGATPAWPGQRGFVGGSMGDDAVILEGADPNAADDNGKSEWLQKQALQSTVHGAGRVMSRRQAKREVSRDAMREWLNGRGVILRGAGLDESPQAYRRLPDVLEAQGTTVNVLHTLRPVIVCMAND